MNKNKKQMKIDEAIRVTNNNYVLKQESFDAMTALDNVRRAKEIWQNKAITFREALEMIKYWDCEICEAIHGPKWNCENETHCEEAEELYIDETLKKVDSPDYFYEKPFRRFPNS